MGWYDYLTDLTSSLSFSDAYADDQSRGAPQGQDMAPDHSTGEDVKGGGVGSAQQDRGAGTKGGVSGGVPAAGTDEESSSEKEANAGDAESAKQRSSGEGEKGHTPGEGGEASGQVGKENAGPHGGSVGGDDDEEEEDEEEEEEEEEEPEDIKPKLEEECMRTKECAPLKHHYDECAERVTKQQEEHGKAHEDCVEEFFHLMHCASQCAAPKLWRQLA